MSKKIKFTEVTHQWEGTAIVRTEQGLQEIKLGVKGSTLKLKETGAKELFKGVEPQGTIALEVKKNADIEIVYEMEVEEFKKVASVLEVPTEEKPVEELQTKQAQ